MSSRACSQCGCTDIDIDQARGDAVCTHCGSVLEDQIIVSEVQFQENSAGGTSVIGQYVSQDGTKTQGLGGFHHGFARESRTLTLQNGQSKFLQPQALASGNLSTNVYALGRTYLAISKELCINIPAIDPCLYVSRFAHKLEFGDKTHEVSMMALRLLQRMKRDWMHTGRRPSGLCGAAILVAARIHNFSRSVRDLIKVVKVCESTIRKRLTEFSDTASSQLTIDEFIKIDLEEEHDPPCFTENKRKARLAQLEEANKLKDLTAEISSLQNEIEKSLETKKSRGMFGAYSKMSDDPSEDLDSVEAASNFLAEEAVMDATAQALGAEEEARKGNETEGERCTDPEKLVCLTRREALTAQGLTPSAASLGIKEVVEDCMKDGSDAGSNCGSVIDEAHGELDLEGIDDDELNWMILSEEEVKIKTNVWMKANADYLQEQKEKAERKAKEEEEEASKPEKKKKRTYKKRTQQTGEASSAREALAKMLLEKKLSNKINYDVLNDLNCKAVKTETKPGIGGPDTPTPDKSVADIKPSKSILNRFKRQSINLETKHEVQDEPDSKRVRFEEIKPDIVIESGPVQYEAKDSREELHVEEEEDFEEEEEEEQHVSAAELLGHSVSDAGYDDDPDEYYLDDD